MLHSQTFSMMERRSRNHADECAHNESDSHTKAGMAVMACRNGIPACRHAGMPACRHEIPVEYPPVPSIRMNKKNFDGIDESSLCVRLKFFVRWKVWRPSQNFHEARIIVDGATTCSAGLGTAPARRRRCPGETPPPGREPRVSPRSEKLLPSPSPTKPLPSPSHKPDIGSRTATAFLSRARPSSQLSRSRPPPLCPSKNARGHSRSPSPPPFRHRLSHPLHDV